MKKTSLLFLLVFTILSPLLAQAKSSVWLAEKGNNKILIGGTVHLIHPSQLPLPDEYQKALDNSKRLVLEVDIEEAGSMASAAKMMQQFMLPQGQTLQNILKPAVWNKLNNYMQANKIPAHLAMLDAAFMSISLPLIYYQQQGYNAGIDKILATAAKQQNMQLKALETMDQQIAALATLRKIEPNTLIETVLEELENPSFSLKLMIKGIYIGDLATLETQITRYQETGLEEFYQNLVIKRNQNWIPQIERFASDGVPTFVAVGALHLAGEDSVLKLLENKGYKISYYK